MGNIHKNPKELKLHLEIFKYKDDKNIDLKAIEYRYQHNDYLITQNGNI